MILVFYEVSIMANDYSVFGFSNLFLGKHPNSRPLRPDELILVWIWSGGWWSFFAGDDLNGCFWCLPFILGCSHLLLPVKRLDSTVVSRLAYVFKGDGSGTCLIFSSLWLLICFVFFGVVLARMNWQRRLRWGYFTIGSNGRSVLERPQDGLGLLIAYLGMLLF